MTSKPKSSASLHRAARIEDAVERQLSRVFRRRSWRPGVVAYTGYGSTSWVRLFARVLLTSPSEVADPQKAARGWRSFLTLPVPHATVEIQVGDKSFIATADRGGYLDVRLEASLPPGRHEVIFTLPGFVARPAVGEVVVLDPSATHGLVSDIDDTVLVTMLPRPFLAFWNTFVLPTSARHPVPGMSKLYQDLLAADPRTPVFYLSTGAWNVAPVLDSFLSRHSFPCGPLLLTDWGPTATGWFRSGRAHKAASLQRLAEEFPNLQWILVGDDGQHDPVLYGEFAATYPGKVAAVAIRHLSPAEQVLAHGLAPVDPRPSADIPKSTPWVVGPDGSALASALLKLDVLTGKAL